MATTIDELKQNVNEFLLSSSSMKKNIIIKFDENTCNVLSDLLIDAGVEAPLGGGTGPDGTYVKSDLISLVETIPDCAILFTYYYNKGWLVQNRVDDAMQIANPDHESREPFPKKHLVDYVNLLEGGSESRRMRAGVYIRRWNS